MEACCQRQDAQRHIERKVARHVPPCATPWQRATYHVDGPMAWCEGQGWPWARPFRQGRHEASVCEGRQAGWLAGHASRPVAWHLITAGGPSWCMTLRGAKLVKAPPHSVLVLRIQEGRLEASKFRSRPCLPQQSRLCHPLSIVSTSRPAAPAVQATRAGQPHHVVKRPKKRVSPLLM